MNGQDRKFLNKFIIDMSKTVADLRARFEEKWDAHDERSEDIWKEVRSKISGIFVKLENFERLQTDVKWLKWTVRTMIVAIIGSIAYILRK